MFCLWLNSFGHFFGIRNCRKKNCCLSCKTLRGIISIPASLQRLFLAFNNMILNSRLVGSTERAIHLIIIIGKLILLSKKWKIRPGWERGRGPRPRFLTNDLYDDAQPGKSSHTHKLTINIGYCEGLPSDSYYILWEKIKQ